MLVELNRKESKTTSASLNQQQLAKKCNTAGVMASTKHTTAQHANTLSKTTTRKQLQTAC
jgi:hypothetical protein